MIKSNLDKIKDGSYQKKVASNDSQENSELSADSQQSQKEEPNTFEKPIEIKSLEKAEKFSKDHFHYKEEADRWMCPSGQNLEFIDDRFVIFRNEIRNKMQTDAAQEIYAKRSPEIEGVFGQIKNNRDLRRFVLRGLEKVKAWLDELKLKHIKNTRF